MVDVTLGEAEENFCVSSAHWKREREGKGVNLSFLPFPSGPQSSITSTSPSCRKSLMVVADRLIDAHISS